MGAFRLKKAPRIPAVSTVLVAVIASVALIVIGFELFADLLFVTPPETLCPLRAGTGIPCPGCGGTRSARALLQFDLPSALAHNPLLAFGALVVFAALGIRLIFGCTIDCALTQRQWGLLGIVCGALILLNWAWVLGRHGVLPLGNAPVASSVSATAQ
ncbi:MAG: hypothetical protein CMJ53_09065 [Planctomycetaceae bacterium]|nr:hypothetical protein [Planctomycetaceae bacterium]